MSNSIDYDEKIQKLLQEGRKLGASVFPNINFQSTMEPSKAADGNKQSLDATSKISVSAIEKELNHQAQETTRLQEELNSARDNIKKTGQTLSDGFGNSIYGSVAFSLPQNSLFKPISSNNSNINSNKPFSYPFQSNETQLLTNTKLHLENALEDSQAQVEYLTNKLESMRKSMEEQKERFRSAVEELQGKLHDTVVGRKKLLDLRQQDMQQQEETIHRLQTTLKELAASNQMQEQALLDAHERMEILESRNQSNERAMSHIRSILASVISKDSGRNKSSSFSSADHLSELIPEVLIDNLEKFVNGSFAEADSLRNKMLQLEAELNAAKQAQEADRLLASTDAAELEAKLKLDHQTELGKEISRRKEAEDSLNLLTNQLKELQIDHTTQVRLVDQSRNQISNLNQQLDELRQLHCNEKGDLQSKMVCMDYDVKLLKDKNERLTEENQNYKQSISELNNTIQQLSTELTTEREMRANLSMKEGDLSKDIRDIRTQLESKNSEISRLREIAAQLRGDLNAKVAKEITEAESVQRMKADERISAISEENIGLREDLSRTKASFQAVERQLADVTSDRAEAMHMVKDKDKQVDRLTSQLSLSDRKLIEAVEAKKSIEEKLKNSQLDYVEASRSAKQLQSDLERLRAVTDDKERIAMQLRHQLDNKNETLKATELKADEVLKENDLLKSCNKEQSEANERLKFDLKNKSDVLMDYEKRLKDVVNEKEKIVLDVHKIENQITSLVEAKNEVEMELQEARSQLSRLIEERDGLSKELRSSEDSFRFELDKLRKELLKKKTDLKIFQEAIHSVKQIDGKAAIYASNMQKEVSDKRGVIDALQTELSNVYDKLDIVQRNGKYLKKENSKLLKQVEEIKNNCKKTEQELRNKTKSEKSHRLAVERLESALEQAAERNAAAQMMINRQESELSKAHIRWNLDMMDKKIIPGVVTDERVFMNPTINGGFGRPPASSGNLMLLHNMLARILATMATNQPHHHDNAIPLNPDTADRKPESQPSSNLSMEEIYKVLTEVREQLSRNSRHGNMTSQVKRSSKARKRDGCRRRTASANERDFPIVCLQSDISSAYSEPSSTEVELINAPFPVCHSQDILRTSSPHSHANDINFANPPSPVSMLLAGGDSTCKSPVETRNLRSNGYSPIRNKDKSFTDKPVKTQTSEDVRDKFVKDAISDNAEELCRQLQDRLEGLSKIGGKLERQNKVAAKLMKKQDKKLKHVRESNPLFR